MFSIRSGEGLTRKTGVSSRNSLQWPIFIINSVDKTNLSCYTPTEAAPIIDNHLMADNYLIELPRAQALISFDHRSGQTG